MNIKVTRVYCETLWNIWTVEENIWNIWTENIWTIWAVEENPVSLPR